MGSVVPRKVEVNVGDVQDAPLLGVQLAQKDHALQHRLRRLVEGRKSKRSPSTLVLEEELCDCSRGSKQVDTHHVPRHAEAEHEQRQVVLFGPRRSKSFQSIGGKQLDEAREAALIELCPAVVKQVEDLVVVVEALLGGQVVEPPRSKLIINNREERSGIATDHQLDYLGVVVVLDRPVQGALAVGVRDAQNAWSRQWIYLRKSPLGAEGG